MEIKLTKDYRGKETKEVFYAAGSVIPVRDDYAQNLIGLGFAVKFDGGEGGVSFPPPPVDPTLETKSMMTPEVAGIVARDNDLIIQSLREEVLVEKEVGGKKMLVKFKKDRKVGDRQYREGQVTQLPDVVAQQLIDDGVARIASLFEHETPAEEEAPEVIAPVVEEKPVPKPAHKRGLPERDRTQTGKKAKK